MKINTERSGAVPFWFWNGDQQETEITRQLELAKQGGWRGMTLHARLGNKTEYLSDRWMELFRHACIEAKRLGLEIWLYDEEGFPSGSIGGRLPALGEKYQQKRLAYEVKTAKEAKTFDNVFICFDRHDPAKIVSLPDAADDAELLVFRRIVLDNFVDYLSREAADAFLRLTHEKYEKAIGEFFGNVVPVVYTDDIQYMFGNGTLVWSDHLEDAFSARFGYSIREQLSALVENLPASTKVRHDFRCLVTDMLNVNFVRPMEQWSKAHNMIFTGHLCCDEGPLTSMIRSFGDPSAFYMEEDIPGVDDFLTGNQKLTYMTEPRNTFARPINGVQGFPITTLCKQASSISSQFKNGLCSSEVLTSLGWGVPFYNQMAQIKFEFALGVNIIVHHDCAYTTEGVTKRDHPASFFFQQPYFAVNAQLYAPIDRTLALLSRGRVDADVLVLHPVNAANITEDGVRIMTDGHSESDDYSVIDPLPRGTHDAHFLTSFLQDLNLELLRRHISFEYGYERIMAQYAKLENGKIRIGDCAYSTVIVPAFEPVESAVAELLKAFEKQGGRVIRLAEKVTELPDGITPDLTGSIPPEVVIGTRLVDGKREHYLVNYGSNEQVTIDTLTEFDVYDPERNAILTTDANTIRMPYLTALHLLPKGELEEVKSINIMQTAGDSLNGCKWQITPERKNIFVLDRGTDEEGKLTMFDGVEHLGGTYTIPLNMTGGSAELFYEKSSSALEVNGTMVEPSATVNHPATQALSGAAIELKNGENMFAVHVVEGARPEYAYLQGDFAVSLDRDGATISKMEHPLTFGDLSEQGFPFYWGAVRYETAIPASDSDLLLELPAVEGVAEVTVNDVPLGVSHRRQAEFIIGSELLKAETNRIVIKLYNTAQNFFGPHRKGHLRPGVWNWQKDDLYTGAAEDYSVASFGILAEPVIKTIKY